MADNRLACNLSFAQIQFLKDKHITIQDIIFLPCTELKKSLMCTLTPEEKEQLNKLRKRGREKWLHVLECEKLEEEIQKLEGTVSKLKSEKMKYIEEIDKLKILFYLAADGSMDVL
ncbi:hypothetical protein LOD99_13747 [Oopsacas minuta]|uniref:Uncharacterized protein n=1 Tax=Oopsacas minuta TaxID=111878 RepID=A0AAV7KJC4_9METZ|nr:hypothetical protein LOD99_13747 [Oopsacas minuta]